MKKLNFRKFSLLFCILACVFSLTGCSDTISSDKAKESTKQKHVEQYAEDLQIWAANMIAFLDVTTDENIKEFAENSDTLDDILDYDFVVNPDGMNVATVEFYNGWVKSREDIGKVTAINNMKVVISEETGTLCTVTVELACTNRTCNIEFVIGEDFNLESGAINPTYTTMEKMEKAAMNTIIGMGTVFIVLIFISFIIYLLKFVNLIGAKKEEPAKAAPAAGVDNAIAQIVTSEENEADDLELVAVITAAIAAAEGTSADGLVVRSIRKVKKSSWK